MMKRDLMTPLLIAALVGCDGGAPALAGPPIGVNAAVTQQSFTPLSLVFLNTCNGDLFHVTGTVHDVRTVTYDKAGGVHQTVHVNFQWASGVSQLTGIRYKVVSTQAVSVNNPGGLPFEQTTQVIVKLVGSGPDDNSTFRIRMHLTVNAEGEVTVSFSESEAVCR
jgi:hypothetical protein